MNPAPGARARKVLLVDDDIVVLKIYQTGLRNRGFEVETASDGLAAVKILRGAKPDLMVLDLMMPKMSGVDVLKFVRGQKDLAEMPVVVLSNAYMDGLAREAATVGAQKALLKASCTPAQLAEIIVQMFEGRDGGQDSSKLLAAPEARPAPVERKPAPEPKPRVEPQPEEKLAAAAPLPKPPTPAEAGPNQETRQLFLKQGQVTWVELRNLFESVEAAKNDAERDVRFQGLYRKVHFITTAAGLAGCGDIVRMATAFEALLFEAMEKRARASASVMRTIAASVDFLKVLFEHPTDTVAAEGPWATALAVDDDPLSNRMVTSALTTARVRVRTMEDPVAALEWLKGNSCDLILLDIVMPKMDGFELCRELRALPAYKKTPVIYVAAVDDFDQRAAMLLSGGEDMIAKPIFPLELAVKSVMHLLSSRLRK